MVRVLVVVIVVLSACGYDLSVENCAVVCAADGTACPEGFTCGPEGLCRANMTSACVVASDAVGGVITHVAGRTIHTFDTSWSGTTFMPPAALSSVELLVVGGGGGGGQARGGGGGGAGGLVHVPMFAVTQPPYQIRIGYGGTPGSIGGDSSFGGILAFGGGAGRPSSPANGGSGGGVSHDTNGGGAGAGTPGQGTSGGPGGFNNGSSAFTGGGGGGAGGAGASGARNLGGAGGPGLAVETSGTRVFYAGGGGGGGQDIGVGLAPGVGGVGGGGDGGINEIGKDAADGTGGGGGGGSQSDPVTFDGGRGGDGVVIVSYPTQR